MGAKQILDSVWIFNYPTNLAAKAIGTDLRTHLLIPEDRLLVIEIGQDAGLLICVGKGQRSNAVVDWR